MKAIKVLKIAPVIFCQAILVLYSWVFSRQVSICYWPHGGRGKVLYGGQLSTRRGLFTHYRSHYIMFPPDFQQFFRRVGNLEDVDECNVSLILLAQHMKLIYISEGTSVPLHELLVCMIMRWAWVFKIFRKKRGFPTFISCSEKEKILVKRFMVCYKVILFNVRVRCISHGIRIAGRGFYVDHCRTWWGLVLLHQRWDFRPVV